MITAINCVSLILIYGKFPTKIIIAPSGDIVEVYVGEVPGFYACLDGHDAITAHAAELAECHEL